MPPFIVLVLEVEEDFEKIIKESRPSASENQKEQLRQQQVQVYQSTWADIEIGPCNNYSFPLKSRCPVSLQSTWKNRVKTIQSPEIKIYPDLVLIRNEPLTAHQDYRNKLLALLFSEVPCMNSARAVLLGLDRPTMMAAIASASRKMFIDAIRNNKKNKSKKNTENDDDGTSLNVTPIPLVEQEFFSNHATCSYSRLYPAVIKFGSAHAAMGKAKVETRHAMDDMRSILPMTKAEYASAEPFLTGSHDLRLQKIGKSNYRIFKRSSTNKNDWKTNDAWCTVEEVAGPVEERYRQWLDACQKMYPDVGDSRDAGYMDVLTIDVLVEAKTGKEWVMEVNGSASGFFDYQDQIELGRCVWERIAEVEEEMKEKNEAEEMMGMMMANSVGKSKTEVDNLELEEMKRKRHEDLSAVLKFFKK